MMLRVAASSSSYVGLQSLTDIRWGVPMLLVFIPLMLDRPVWLMVLPTIVTLVPPVRKALGPSVGQLLAATWTFAKQPIWERQAKGWDEQSEPPTYSRRANRRPVSRSPAAWSEGGGLNDWNAPGGRGKSNNQIFPKSSAGRSDPRYAQPVERSDWDYQEAAEWERGGWPSGTAVPQDGQMWDGGHSSRVVAANEESGGRRRRDQRGDSASAVRMLPAPGQGLASSGKRDRDGSPSYGPYYARAYVTRPPRTMSPIGNSGNRPSSQTRRTSLEDSSFQQSYETPQTHPRRHNARADNLGLEERPGDLSESNKSELMQQLLTFIPFLRSWGGFLS